MQLTRKDVKQAAMTVFYGSKKTPEQVFGKDSEELDAFYTAIMKLAPGAYELLQDIQSCWNPNAYVHSWTLPDGHRVHAKVMVTNDKKVEVDELEHATFTYRTEINEPSWFGLSLAANVIHSVDGYVAREMVKRTHALGFQMATIHDCFYASPNHMNEVRRTYTEILAEIADSNLMRDILRELTGNPAQAFYKLTSNLSTYIRKSEYALS